MSKSNNEISDELLAEIVSTNDQVQALVALPSLTDEQQEELETLVRRVNDLSIERVKLM